MLRTRAARVRRNERAIRKREPFVVAAIIFPLWAATILLSDIPLIIVTIFWIGVSGVVSLWNKLADDPLGAWGNALRAGMRRDTADVYEIKATGFVEFEQVDDEGEMYAFQLDGERMVFLWGDAMTSGAKFPSLDFAIVHALDENGLPMVEWVEKRGSRAAPLRVIPVSGRRVLAAMEHLDIISGCLEDIEALSSPASRRMR